MKLRRRVAPVTAIYTDIGRGHPNYLDSVLRYIKKNHAEKCQQIRVTSIFEISSGLSLRGWQMVRKMYRLGSRGGCVSNLYSRFRSGQAEYNQNSKLIKLLRRDLHTYLAEYGGICLVAHPLLANMLKDSHRVFYLHGEIAVPRESGIRGIEKIYVPLPETAKKMLTMGVAADSLVVTGLVLEPELCENINEVIQRRIERIKSAQPLTVGFFISGAYPQRHVRLIIEGVKSCYQTKMKARLFWGCNRQGVKRLIQTLRKFAGEVTYDESTGQPVSDAAILVITAGSREAETISSTDYLPEIDVFCAAPHERVSWAVGAGLPMVMIAPPIGTFAPENRAFVLQSGCGFELSNDNSFSRLGEKLNQIRQDGQLMKMIESSRKIKSIFGAKTIAEDLFNEIS